MGTFVGHVAPGSCFVLFGLWWTVQVLRRHYRCGQNKESNQASVACPWKINPQSVEGAVKCVGALVAIGGELSAGIMNTVGFPLVNGQHSTMYFFLGMSGVADIVTRKSALLRELHLDYVTLAMAFAMEFLIFKFHLHGRDALDVDVHQLLIVVIAACFVCVVMEGFNRTYLLAALGKSYFTILQGTWLIQIGFILYNPFPQANPTRKIDKDNTMWAVRLFVWHGVGLCLVTLLLACCFGCVYKRSARGKATYERVSNIQEDEWESEVDCPLAKRNN